MEVDDQVIAGGGIDDALVEVHHLLIVAVHVVDLHPLDPPLLIERERHVHLIAHVLPHDPEDDADVLRVGVADDLRQVDLRDRGGDVLVGIVVRAVPFGIDQQVLEPDRGGEIDVVLHRRGVHPALEGPALDGTRRPPGPGDLARSDPGRILDDAAIGEVHDHVRLDHPAGMIGHHEDAPRQVVRRGDPRRQPRPVGQR